MNIVELVIKLIEENGAVSTAKIIESIENKDLIKLKPKRLEALIYNDLMTDGRFLLIDNTWDIKVNYTMQEILREQYRSIGDVDISKLLDTEEEEFSEEIEMTLSIDRENNDDDTIIINNIESMSDLVDEINVKH